MKGFHIAFSHPWLLLLILPALALTFFLYFRLDKRYRRTRNRIISMVLHVIVSVLAICVLAGITFPYELENSKNELILLVDVSDTQEDPENMRDDFVEQVLHETSYDGFKVGIVTFGFDQVYAVPLTYDIGSIYPAYLAADLPDTSATDIAAALRYTATLFEYPETAKILLISDGMETDESAATVVRSVAVQGIKVDTTLFDYSMADDGIQITSIALPDHNIVAGTPCDIGVTVYSEKQTEGAEVTLFDCAKPDVPLGVQTVDLLGGTQVFTFQVTFEGQGLHELCATAAPGGGEANNRYYTHVYLTVHDKILVLEQRSGDSDMLLGLLEEEYPSDGIHLLDIYGGDLPKTVDELRAYDQVIMNNIAEADLPDGFYEILQEYVYRYGGGLFTTGGSNDDGTAHAYNREDLYGTDYHNMLPVQAVDYTPPVGVVVVIDISGSMDETRRQWAKNGAITCLDVLNARDYIGVMTLEVTYGTALQLTSCTQENRGDIIRAINGIGVGTGTRFTNAIDHAAQALRAEKRIDKRHIVLVTDGMPADNDLAISRAESYRDITLSVVGIDLNADTAAAMNRLTDAWKGRTHNAMGETDIMDSVRNDLSAPSIQEYIAKEFYPVIANRISPVVNGVEYGVEGEDALAIPARLGGYYGVRARGGAQVIVTGEYDVPIYAQWQYGAGKVGSFMCDVYGRWSGEFLSNQNGKRLLLNIVAELMPATDIHPTSITLTLREENYINRLSVDPGTLENGQTIEGEIEYHSDSGASSTISLNNLATEGTQDTGFYLTAGLSAENGFTRCSFVCKEGGTYTLTVRKRDAEGNVLETVQIFKSFSYSREYNKLAARNGNVLLADLAAKGNGATVSSQTPEQVLEGFDTELTRVFDPTLTFMILVMVLFLLDVAVRKFKFKWIHELIREKRAQRRDAS